jgi:adhesin transport system outer membrane protein
MARYHVNPIPPADLLENSIPNPALAPTQMAPGQPTPAAVPGEPSPTPGGQ